MDDRTADSPAEWAARAQQAMDAKTKPPGSLGRLESVAVRLATLQRTLTPTADSARVLVFAADHGVAAQGVSAYPPEVTAQMVHGFVAGGAAVAVLAKAAGASLRAIDVGVNGDLSALTGERIVHAKVCHGTADLSVGPAMTHEQRDAALQVGREAVVQAANDGVRVLCLGEMGIGNTTAAAILTAVLADTDADTAVGRGTGVDDERLAHKRELVRNVITRAAPLADDPMDLLREVGGLEIAALVGALLEASAHDLAVLVDGYIVTSAALVATAVRPSIAPHLFYAHRSAEPGHAAALDTLGARPLLDLDLRLGEASGAVLALPLLRAACTVLADMATFESAGVSGPSD